MNRLDTLQLTDCLTHCQKSFSYPAALQDFCGSTGSITKHTVMYAFIVCSVQGIGDSGQGFVNALLFCVFTPKVRKQFLLLLLNSRCLRRQCALVRTRTSQDSHDSLSSTFPVMRSKPRKFVDSPMSQEDQHTSQNDENHWHNLLLHFDHTSFRKIFF